MRRTKILVSKGEVEWTCVLALAVWGVFHFQRDRQAKRRVRIVVAAASLLVGAALCVVSHEPRPAVRVVGFPLALRVFRLEQGIWIDSVPTSDRLLWRGGLNIALVAGTAHAVASVVLKWRRQGAG